jgi:hypothetical protein
MRVSACQAIRDIRKGSWPYGSVHRVYLLSGCCRSSSSGARTARAGSTGTGTPRLTIRASRLALWAAVDAAGAALEAKQGADPAAWRANATAERIRFAPGILPATMRWANRPTFQQVISFSGHR